MANTNYQWNAADYAKNSAGQFQWAKELIDKLNLAGHETVLDIGCGDGKVTAAIAERLPKGRAVGIDSSPAMIELANQAFPAATHPKLGFRLMDVRDLDFTDEFDVLFSNAALHWVRDHRPFLGKVCRALKPGGRLLFQMGGQGNARDMLATMDDLMSRDRWAPYFEHFEMPYGFHGIDMYRRWMDEAGLCISRIELIPKDMTHPGRNGLGGWVRTTWLPYLERVPEAERSDFLDDLLTTYLKRIPLDQDGLAHVGMVRLEVEAARRPA